MAAGETYPLGPGVLTIGATGTEIDVSGLVNNAVVASDKDQGDDTTKLDGTVVAGAVTYTFTLSGNVDIDITDPAGLFMLSHQAAGTQQEFSYTPNSDAGTSATGTVTIDPLDFGGDETGQTMASDFEWSVIGKPTITPGTGATADADQAAA